MRRRVPKPQAWVGKQVGCEATVSHHSHQKKASILIQDWCFFQRNKSFRICEIHFVREILLRNVKYALRRVDLFHFTESVSFLFHNFYKKLFHIKHCLIFHLYTICIIYTNRHVPFYIITTNYLVFSSLYIAFIKYFCTPPKMRCAYPV